MCSDITVQINNSSIMFAHKLQFDNVELDAKLETINVILPNIM